MNESLKLALCEMQAELFAFSREKGYASESFIKTFMLSGAAKDLDMPFHHMQWAGMNYLLSRLEEEHRDELQTGACYDAETLYWIGYLYRYWHLYTGESSKAIYKQAPAKTMNIVYLMYHTMSPEMAVDRLKASYREIHK
ncbi:MAG: hypothetical protein J6C51_01360 [Clostridia bacterium]|nr:hypothetical protein [Clostridia bacterium]